MEVTALAGGTGGAKLLVGLQQVLLNPTAIVNTGDDEVIYGVHVSPDVDMVTYWLAGIADTDRGWGLKGDTFSVVERLAELGHDAWFRLGDRDLATCLLRTQAMRNGMSLSQVADDLRRSLGVTTRILPMTDEAVRTRITTADGRSLSFQEYFVKERHEPPVATIVLDGIDAAKPAPGVLDALRGADMIVVCPSNPVLSIGPILQLPEIRATLHAHPRVVAVSPIVRGAPLKGPADESLRAVGAEVSASGVAALYRDFVNVYVVDERDPEEAEKVRDLGAQPFLTDTIMNDRDAARRLARAIL